MDGNSAKLVAYAFYHTCWSKQISDAVFLAEDAPLRGVEEPIYGIPVDLVKTFESRPVTPSHDTTFD